MDWEKILTFVSPVVAILAFVLSLFNLQRAVTTDQRSRELVYSSEKQIALVTVRQEEAIASTKLNKLQRLLANAEAVKGEKVIELLNTEISSFKNQIAMLTELRKRFDKSPKNTSYHDLLELRENITKLKQLQTNVSDDDTFNFFYEEAKREIKLLR